jgi:hypothetical protein
LPKRPEPNLRHAAKPFRKRQLQVVHGIRECLARRLTDQKVHMFGHDHVSIDTDAELETHVLKASKEEITGGGNLESRLATMTTEGKEAIGQNGDMGVIRWACKET